MIGELRRAITTGEVKIEWNLDFGRVQRAVDQAAFRNFGHAAASIRKDAQASIETSPEPSEPGTPPHTRRRKHLQRAIRFAADKEGGVVGPVYSVVGEAGAAHEHGETFRGDEFAERSYMGPALERALPRFASDWRGSVVDV